MLAVQPAVDFDTTAVVVRASHRGAENVRRTFGEEGCAPVVERGVYVAERDFARNSVGRRETRCDRLRRGVGTKLPPNFGGSGIQQEQSLEVGADKDKSARDFKRPRQRLFGSGWAVGRVETAAGGRCG